MPVGYATARHIQSCSQRPRYLPASISIRCFAFRSLTSAVFTVHPFHSAATAAKVLFSWLHRPRMHNDHATVTHCLPQAPVLLTPIADAPHSAPSPLLPPLHPASTMSAFEPAKCQTNTSAAPPLLSTASSSTVSSSEPLAAPQQNLGPAPLPPCSSAASSSTASADPSFRSWRTYRQPSFSCPMISPGCYCTCQDHNHSVTALCEFVREFGPTGHFIDYQRWMPNNESLPQIMDSVNGIFAHGPGGCSSSVTPSPGCDDSAWRSFSHIDETEFDVHHYRSHLERAHADGPPRCLAEQYRQKSFNFKSASSDAKHTSNSVPPEKSTLDCVRFISACEEVCLSYSDAREIVLVVLLHQSLPGIDEYPPLAPLPQHLIASHITSRLLQLLLPCMLADSASYTMASAFDTQRYATNIRKSVDKLLQTIEKAGQ